MTYRVLVLPEEANKLTVAAARKIRDLVASGAIVIAPKPLQSPSLADYPDSDTEIRKLANEVWGAVDGKGISEHNYGKGKVFWGRTVEEILAAEGTPPDFEYTRPHFDTELVWLHRHAADVDIYFVADQKQNTEELEARFRVSGKEAELWRPIRERSSRQNTESKTGARSCRCISIPLDRCLWCFGIRHLRRRESCPLQ